MIRLSAVIIALGLLLAAACSPFDEDAPRTLTATLSVGEPVRLPDGTAILVELIAVSGEGEAVAEASTVLDGADLPLEVSLTIDPARLEDGQAYALRAALAWDGELQWLSAPLAVNVGQRRIHAGEIRLDPFNSGLPADAGEAPAMEAEEAIFLCGDAIIILNRDADGAALSVEDTEYRLGPAMAGEAEGVLRHESADGQSWFDDAGATARYAIDGESGPDCVRLY
ncbi:YbaY family lipoprotein [Glycocaulis sp.]|uniref:YbaY family lipoprotein n=1 Tax=Glycocaulis sp. TaxID=1969725 RepID=UPI003F7116D5